MVSREYVRGCIHPHTYKYYLDREAVRDVWRTLQAALGPVEHESGFGVMQITTPRLIIRATRAGNPITVIRKRRCGQTDVAKVHDLLGYADE